MDAGADLGGGGVNLSVCCDIKDLKMFYHCLHANDTFLYNCSKNQVFKLNSFLD